MTKHNAENERVKHRYFAYLKEARRHSETTVDATAKALDRFEHYTNHRDFRAFHSQQAIAFKRHLTEQRAAKSGDRLSKATLNTTLAQLKRFFQWLSLQPGFKSRIRHSDADYFNLSEKEARIATTRREQKVPTLEQVKQVVITMPANTEIERRNRALVAFTLLTGARDSAIASMKLKHVDLIENCVDQDAREVNTKFSKTFRTYFFPVGDEIRTVFEEWVSYLKEKKHWGNADPLFPATQVGLGATRQFEVSGLKRCHWRNASPLRKIFREAFVGACLPYFNPHSFRNTLVQLGQQLCKTPEHFKAWSQNLGHESPLTTFVSYGEVACRRQGEIIRGLSGQRENLGPDVNEFADAVAMNYTLAQRGASRIEDAIDIVRELRRILEDSRFRGSPCQAYRDQEKVEQTRRTLDGLLQQMQSAAKQLTFEGVLINDPGD